MNNCEHIEDLFSDRFDGALNARDQETFDKHLATCANCNGNWIEFQAAVGMLRTSGAGETSPELRAATLAAVATALAPARNPSRTKPLLLAAFLGAAAALLLAWLVVGIDANGTDSNRAPSITVDAEVVALQPGESRTQSGLRLSRSNSGQWTVRAETIEPKIVEVRVEVPVERIVEVPVETPVEVPVEVIVEVPVFVEVDRVPWFTVDTTQLAAALRDAGKQLGSGMEALATAHRSSPGPAVGAPRNTVRSPVAQITRPPRQTQAPEARASGAALRVQRTGGRIQLETSGTIEDLVPTLLAQLETPDVELCSLIQRQLAAIHEEAARDPEIGDALADMPSGRVDTTERSMFGDPKRTERAAVPALAWAKWWHANSYLLTQVASL